MVPETITFLHDSRNIEKNESEMGKIFFPPETLFLNGDPKYCYIDYHLPTEYLLKKYYPGLHINYVKDNELKHGNRAIYRLSFRYFMDYLAREGAGLLDSVPDNIRKEQKVLLLFNDVQEYAFYHDVDLVYWKPFVRRVSKESLNKRIMLVSGNKGHQGESITFGKTGMRGLDYFLKDNFGPIHGYRYFEEVVSFQRKTHYPAYSYIEKQKYLEGNDIRLFLHLNRVIKDFRTTSVYLLWKQGLLHQGFVSHPSLSENDRQNMGTSRFSELKESDFGLFMQSLPMVLDTERFHVNQWNNLPFHFVNKSFLWLVSETLFDTDDNLKGGFMTEKTYKPISLFMPFIIMGNPYTLKRLRNDGYETFSAWWDESYDEEVEPTKRMHKIMELLNSLKQMSQKQVQEMYGEMKAVLEHNAARLSATEEGKPFVEALMDKYNSL